MVIETVGSSKTGNIKSLLIRAWRERWSDMQWGIHIKTVLPRYISGDIYHLSDCILQQALMGPLPNQLILSYLRHSLAAHIVSYGGVIETISKYESSFHKPHCVRALLDLLSNMVEKMTCRGKPEDCLALATALVAGVKWLLKVILYASGKAGSLDQLANLKISVDIIQQYMKSPFLKGLLHIARLEDSTLWNQLIAHTSEVESKLSTIEAFADIKETLSRDFIDLHVTSPLNCHQPKIRYNPSNTPICYGLHARLMVEAVMHSTHSTQTLANQLVLYRHLKGMSEANLFLELLASSFLGLGGDEEFPHQVLHWVGFTFIKVPAIINNIHMCLQSAPGSQQSSSEALVAAISGLARRTDLLDTVDYKLNCNCLELLLRELKMHTTLLVNHDISVMLALRLEDPMAVCIGGTGVPAKEGSANPNPTPTLIIRAEPTVTSILQTLSKRNQEGVLQVMNLLISGKSRDLLLTAAAASGKLLSYSQKFVKFNQQSLEPQPDETELAAKNRALMFDITFLLLCHIAQVYGVDAVVGEEDDTYIENWMRHHMPDKGRVKSGITQYKADNATIMEVIQQVRAPDMGSKYGQGSWSKVCKMAPSLMQKLASEVTQGVITHQAATEILDIMYGHFCALPIIFVSWICSHVHDSTDPKIQALLEHLQSKLTNPDPSLSLDCFKDRSMLMTEIINNMLKVTKEKTILDISKETPETSFFSPIISSILGSDGEKSKAPAKVDNDLSEVMQRCWEDVFKKSGILTHSGLCSFQRLIRLAGYDSFVSTIVKCGMENVFAADLTKAMDLIYGIFQIDLQRCCLSLLLTCLPYYLTEPGSFALESYHRIGALARLIVQVLVAAWATAIEPSSPVPSATSPSVASVLPTPNSSNRKRPYSCLADGEDIEEQLLRQTSTLTIDPSSVQNLSNSAVALMVALQHFLTRMYEVVPKGVVSPVSELMVCLLKEFVTAPPVLSPLLTLLPANLLPILVTLHSADTFTPSELLALALPAPSASLNAPLTPGQEAAARRGAAKLLCMHRNLVLQEVWDDIENKSPAS